MPRLVNAVRAALKLSLIAGIAALGSCSTAGVILQTAPNTLPTGYAAPVSNPLPADTAKALLQSEVYGRVIAPTDVEVMRYDVLATDALEGMATLSQWRVSAGYGAARRELDIVLLMPNAVPNAPVILQQSFCPNNAVIPLPGVTAPGESSFCEGGGFAGTIMTYFFGRHIVKPPLADIIADGFGFSAIYPSQYVPDSARAGNRVLDSLFPDSADRPGALAVWAGLADMTAGLIENELGERDFIASGHSRFGKTALIAGGWFDDIDAVISHQSGTLGASTLTDKTGESLDSLVENYPHWGNRKVATYGDNPQSLPVAPHDLLALLSEKPVLLGNARRDTWSDPFGAYKEAQAAWGPDFTASTPADFDASSRKAFWQRPGTHGVVKEDWEAFRAWLSEIYE